MDDFVPATVTGYSEWPKNTPNYWALPAFGDVVGWTYRKDWFERPELQAEFKEKYGRDLAVPATFAELKDIAEFFQGRDIDGKTVYGASIYTERGSEGITMGVMDVLYSFGFKYDNPDKPYDMEGFVNSPGAVAGLEFYKALYDCCTPPGSSNGYMGEGIDAYKSGQVAMQMNFAFTWPGFEADPNVGGGKTGYFVNPAGPNGEQFAQLGGQGISVVSLFRKAGRGAGLHQVVRPARSAGRNGGRLGGYSALRAVVEDPGFAASQPYAQTFLDSMAIVKDFWAEPAMPRCCRRRRSGSTTMSWPATAPRKEALDGLVADWTEVFEDEGKLLSLDLPGRCRAERRAREALEGQPGLAHHCPCLTPSGTPHHARHPDRPRRAATPPSCRAPHARACRTGRLPGSSWRRRSSCCWRSTSFR